MKRTNGNLCGFYEFVESWIENEGRSNSTKVHIIWLVYNKGNSKQAQNILNKVMWKKVQSLFSEDEIH